MRNATACFANGLYRKGTSENEKVASISAGPLKSLVKTERHLMLVLLPGRSRNKKRS